LLILIFSYSAFVYSERENQTKRDQGISVPKPSTFIAGLKRHGDLPPETVYLTVPMAKLHLHTYKAVNAQHTGCRPTEVQLVRCWLLYSQALSLQYRWNMPLYRLDLHELHAHT